MFIGRLDMYFGDSVTFRSHAARGRGEVVRTLRGVAKERDGWDRCVLNLYRGGNVFDLVERVELTREELEDDKRKKGNHGRKGNDAE